METSVHKPGDENDLRGPPQWHFIRAGKERWPNNTHPVALASNTAMQAATRYGTYMYEICMHSRPVLYYLVRVMRVKDHSRHLWQFRGEMAGGKKQNMVIFISNANCADCKKEGNAADANH